MKVLSRRELLIAGAGTLALAACRASDRATPISAALVGADSPTVASREQQRVAAGTGRTRTASITAREVTTTIGGKSVSTWAFGDRPGDGGIRVTAGDTLEARFVNELSSANTIHWHGIALRNDMDGVHDLTQSAVQPGAEFTYRFVVPDPGTYWFHPHMGLELDRGLYAPLIVEDPHDTSGADVDATLILDDWLDGYGRTQEDVLAELQSSGGHSGHDMGGMGGMSSGMGGMSGMSGMGGTSALTGDVSYPVHVINGRGPTERDTVQAKAGQRVRLRIINAGSDTAYRLAVAGHRLTITHTDGFPVVPVEVDAVVLGMGERYDVLLTAQSGAFPIVAVPEGKEDTPAEAVLRTTDTVSSPATGSRPDELDAKVASYQELQATDGGTLAPRDPDRTQSIALTASMGGGYRHGIDAKSFPDTTPITIEQGERLRLTIMNDTMMFHPIHLHGHTFQMRGNGSARKDTVNVPSMGSVVVDIDADNPGQWMLHCHNTYHLETGMATVLSYRG